MIRGILLRKSFNRQTINLTSVQSLSVRLCLEFYPPQKRKSNLKTNSLSNFTHNRFNSNSITCINKINTIKFLSFLGCWENNHFNIQHLICGSNNKQNIIAMCSASQHIGLANMLVIIGDKYSNGQI